MLLSAVVEVASEPAPLLEGRGDDPRPRCAQLLGASALGCGVPRLRLAANSCRRFSEDDDRGRTSGPGTGADEYETGT